jgi:hypothetical protein
MTMVAVCVIVPCVLMIVVLRMIIMGVRCAVSVTIAGIGSTFRIERGFDLDDARAEPLHHGFDHVVMTDAKTLSDNLGRQMAVAKMPGQPHEMRRISASNFDKLLRGSYHLDQPAIFQHQSIAAAQGDRFFKVEQEFKTAGTRHRHTAAMTVVETEHDSISCRLDPTMMRMHVRCTDHAIGLTTLITGHPLSRA